MKKALLLSLCAALLLGAAACGNNDNDNNTSGPDVELAAPEVPADPELPMEEIPLENGGEAGQNNAGSEPFTFEPAASFSVEDANMQITISLEKETYTVEDIVPIYITLTNHGDSIVAFEHGSGSMTVPSALDLDLGGLVPLFYPHVMTMDYQITSLEPGQSLYLECPYAPYRPAGEDATAAFGTEQDLEQFQTDDFAPVEPGDISGTYQLTYTVLDGESDPLSLFVDFGQQEMRTLSGDFTVTID